MPDRSSLGSMTVTGPINLPQNGRDNCAAGAKNNQTTNTRYNHKKPRISRPLYFQRENGHDNARTRESYREQIRLEKLPVPSACRYLPIRRSKKATLGKGLQ